MHLALFQVLSSHRWLVATTLDVILGTRRSLLLEVQEVTSRRLGALHLLRGPGHLGRS